jgi:hypothetical protein
VSLRTPLLRLALPLLLAAAHPATARAAEPPVFGAPVPLSPGMVLGVGTAMDGTVTAAIADNESVAGRTRLLVARRPAALNVWSAAESVAEEPATGLMAAYRRDPLGGDAVAWVAPDSPAGTPVVRLRTRGPLATAFGPQADIPLPARRPTAPGNENVIEDSRSVLSLDVATATDGAVALAACVVDYRADEQRAMAWLRPAGGEGTWSDLGRCVGTMRLGADARGGLDLLWTGAPEGTAKAAPRVAWVVHRAPLTAAFGAPLALSDPAQDADNNSGVPDLLITPAGRAVAIWNGVPAGQIFGSRVLVAQRDAAGRWGAPAQVTDAGMRPTLTANVLGATAVVWSGMGIDGVVADAGGAFGPRFSIPSEPGQIERMPAALDAFGDVVVVRRMPQYDLAGYVRNADGSTAGPVAVLPDGFMANETRTVTDAFGNGLVLATALRNRHNAVVAVPYSATPPKLTGLKLDPAALLLDVAEPARLSLQVLAGTRSAKTVATLQPARGRERLTLTAAQRRLVRRRGARVVLRARDAGPRVRTIRRTARALRRR